MQVKFQSENLKGKGNFGRPSRRWKDNIKIGLKEITGEDVDWIYLVQGRGQWCDFLKTVMILWTGRVIVTTGQSGWERNRLKCRLGLCKETNPQTVDSVQYNTNNNGLMDDCTGASNL